MSGRTASPAEGRPPARPRAAGPPALRGAGRHGLLPARAFD